MLHLQPLQEVSPLIHRSDGAVILQHGPIIFLGGSIEMDTAERWQQRIVRYFENKNVTFLNPRRDDWDKNIKQTCEDKNFRDQVNWELNGIQRSDLVVFYIDPATKSPITLMEIGLVAGSGKDAIVCCPEGFWRKGNIEMISDRFDIRMIESFDRLLIFLENYIEQRKHL